MQQLRAIARGLDDLRIEPGGPATVAEQIWAAAVSQTSDCAVAVPLMALAPDQPLTLKGGVLVSVFGNCVARGRMAARVRQL